MSAPATTLCIGCGLDVDIVRGRIATHGVCGIAGAVPWRRGAPDQAAVVRHLQTHRDTGETAAYFQVREGLVFPAIVVASFDASDRLVWGYGIPTVDLSRPHARRIPPNPMWHARPLDIDTHEARPWIDP